MHGTENNLQRNMQMKVYELFVKVQRLESMIGEPPKPGRNPLESISVG